MLTGFAICLIAIGGAFACEGAFYAIVPQTMRDLYKFMFEADNKTLHQSGLFSVAIGMVLIVIGAKMIL